MDSLQEAMLAANTLIHQYGDGAEEYITKQLWGARQKEDEASVSKWRQMLEALKHVRELRAKVKNES
jgi:hypothetical protein